MAEFGGPDPASFDPETGDRVDDDPRETTESAAPKPRRRSGWHELPILIGVALVLSFLLQMFVGRVYLIPSESMEPTLHGCAGCTGDRIVVDKIAYRFGDPEPGDVVVFEGPPSWNTDYSSRRSGNPVLRGIENVGSAVGLVPPDENDLVKRVVAVAGQTVQCRPGDEGLKVDGKTLVEPYIDSRTSPRNGVPCQGVFFGPVVVPDASVWVMGDNRANSKDSRFHMNDDLGGAVPVSNIIGEVRLIVLPPSRWGVVHAVDPQR